MASLTPAMTARNDAAKEHNQSRAMTAPTLTHLFRRAA
jgi:hypothetical protein